MTKKQTGLRFIISYLCVLLPLLTLSFLLFGTLLHSVELEEMDKLDTRLQQTADSLERDLHDYRIKGLTLLQHPEFLDDVTQMNVTGRLDALTLLQRLKLSDGRAEDILIHYGGDLLVSNHGIVLPVTYFSTYTSCDAQNLEMCLGLLQSDSLCVAVLHDVYGVPNYVMYHIPAGTGKIGNYRSVQYIFSIDNFQSFLAYDLESQGMILEIGLHDRAAFFYNNGNGVKCYSHQQASQLLTDYTQYPDEIKLSGMDITVRLWYSELRQMSTVHHLRNITILMLTVGVFLSTLVSFSFGVKRLRSLRSLARNITSNKISRTQSRKWAANEYDYIQALVDESIKDGIAVRNNAKNYRRILLQQVSMMIFHGVLRDKKEIHSVLSVCRAELTEDYFCLCRIDTESHENMALLEELMQEDLHYCEDDACVIVLCQLSGFDHTMAVRKDIGSRLLQTLKSTGISCSGIAISQVYKHISMANYAYLEVSSIQECTGSVVCWEELLAEHDRHGIQLGNEQLQQFYAAVEQKDPARAKKLLNRILEENSQQDLREEDMRYTRYMILQALRLGTRAVLSDEENQQLQKRIDEIELENNVNFMEQITSVLRECSKDSGDTFHQILQFVNANYTHYDLSLEQIAEAAKVSKPQMSKMFRAMTGVGYIEYVTNLRMEKAKELLENTDLSVKDIFNQVGYIDSVNASKKFKSFYGITPSAYRSRLRSGKPDIQTDASTSE